LYEGIHLERAAVWDFWRHDHDNDDGSEDMMKAMVGCMTMLDNYMRRQWWWRDSDDDNDEDNDDGNDNVWSTAVGATNPCSKWVNS
jgi:hypothetical protein